MKLKSLFIIYFTVQNELEDAIIGILNTLLDKPNYSIKKLPYQKELTFELYGNSFNDAQLLQKKLQKLLKTLHSLQLLSDIPLIRVNKIDNKDWQESWKKSFSVTKITPHCIVCPEWIKYTPFDGEHVIIIDPGMAFGTGRHPTTRYSLQKIEENVSPQSSILDLGCGSGILSICAVKFGYKKIIAVDKDGAAIKISQKNAGRNNVQKHITLIKSSLSQFRSDCQFSVIAANITSNILIRNRKKIVLLLKNKGHLILAGITAIKADKTIDAFLPLELNLIDQTIDGEWIGLTFRKTR